MGKPSSERLVASINESAQHVGAATLTFLAACVYIGVAVASTKDEVLLLGTNIGLPLFSVQIPLDKFYILAPALLTFLHLHLLLLQFLLVSKVVKLCQGDNPPEEETDLFFPSLPLSILLGQKHPGMVRFLLWLLLFTITMALPVCLLIATQVRFLPHHSGAITAWHRSLVLLDLALIWYFRLRLPKLPGHEELTPPEGFEPHAWSYSDGKAPQANGLSRLETQTLKSLGWLGGLALTVVAIAFSTLFAGGSEIGGRHFKEDYSFLKRTSSENLSLAESNFGKGVRLTGRDLRKADFTDAVLINADLRGADLTGANLERADLRFAKLFLPAPKGMDGLLGMIKRGFSLETIHRERNRLLNKRTRMQGARLRGADLRSANLFMADLRSSDLQEAVLDGADLRLADLRGANLRGASLKGALLSLSNLNLADLRETSLVGADLARASLLGADLWRARLHAADLSRSDLRGAKLVEAGAVAADFSQARAEGADFQNAVLNAATGLALHGVDLRGAHLAAANLCVSGKSNGPKVALNASDLRSVDVEDRSVKWEPIAAELGTLIPKEAKSAQADVPDTLLRVKDRIDHPPDLAGPTCLALPGDNPTRLLYYKSPVGAPKLWPASVVTEQSYHTELASMLVDQACKNHELAQILLKELAGESVPRRRLLAVAIARRVLDLQQTPQCPPFRRLSEEQRRVIERTVNEDPLRTDD